MAALAPGRVAYLNYGEGEWHQSSVLGHVQGSSYVVMTPGHEIYVEQLGASNEDVEGFRVQAVGGVHPVGILPGEVYLFDPFSAAEHEQILSECRDIVSQERVALGLPPLDPVAAVALAVPPPPPPAVAVPQAIAPAAPQVVAAPGLPPPPGGPLAAGAVPFVVLPVLHLAAPPGSVAGAVAVPYQPAGWPGYPAAAAVQPSAVAAQPAAPPYVALLPSPRPVGVGGSWVLDGLGEGLEVGTEFGLPASASLLSDAKGVSRSLVIIGQEVLSLRFLGPGVDITSWARERKAFLAFDARTLPPARNLSFANAVSLMEHTPRVVELPGSPLLGSPTAPWFVDAVTRSGLTGMVSRDTRWKAESGIGKTDRVVYEHECLSRAIGLAAVVDCLNVENLVCFEFLFRRLQLIRSA